MAAATQMARNCVFGCFVMACSAPSVFENDDHAPVSPVVRVPFAVEGGRKFRHQMARRLENPLRLIFAVLVEVRGSGAMSMRATRERRPGSDRTFLDGKARATPLRWRTRCALAQDRPS